MPSVRLVLASASPARLATLRAAGLDPEVVVSHVDEPALTAAAPVDHAGPLTLLLAGAKADAVAVRTAGDAVVLGCDSLLAFDGTPYGKPGSDDAARQRWHRMAGGTGTLWTGHCAVRVQDGVTTARAEALRLSTVEFGTPSPAELEAYLASGEPQQVAGGFTVDGLGGWFVEGVSDHHTTVGLSLGAVRDMLTELGVGLLDLGWPRRG